MKIDLNQNKNDTLRKDEIIVDLQYSDENENLQHFIDYINNYELTYEKRIMVEDGFTLLEIKYDDIITFYSDKKYNYCKTKTGQYRIKSKLYELEKINTNFIRISKSCIVNINHVEKFDISEVGKITIKLDDFTEEIVSRRRAQNIRKYFENRRI